MSTGTAVAFVTSGQHDTTQAAMNTTAEDVEAEEIRLENVTVSGLEVDLEDLEGGENVVEENFAMMLGDNVEGFEVESVEIGTIESATIEIENDTATIDAQIDNITLRGVQADRVHLGGAAGDGTTVTTPAEDNETDGLTDDNETDGLTDDNETDDNETDGLTDDNETDANETDGLADGNETDGNETDGLTDDNETDDTDNLTTPTEDNETDAGVDTGVGMTGSLLQSLFQSEQLTFDSLTVEGLEIGTLTVERAGADDDGVTTPEDDTNDTVGDDMNDTVGDDTNDTVGDDTNETVGDDTNATDGDDTNETDGDDTFAIKVGDL